LDIQNSKVIEIDSDIGFH